MQRVRSTVRNDRIPPARACNIFCSLCHHSATAGLSKNCATDISVSELTVDGRDRAWGGVSITSAVNVNVGPQVMVIGFQGVGIDLNGCGAGK